MRSSGYGSYAVFISSPGGLEAERQKVRDCISNMNAGLQRLYNMNLVVVSWEDLPPLPPNSPEDRVQDSLNRLVEQCHFFILILHDRYGTTEEGYDKSNTEREVDAIFKKYKGNPKIKILTYLKEIQMNSGASQQTQKVLDLRNRVQNMSFLTKTFSDVDNFSEKVIHDLYQTCIGLQTSSFKRQCLSRFWSLSEVGRDDERALSTDLAIVYRPVDRKFVDGGSDHSYWLKRFMPKVFLEDNKAIQKVQKNLRLIGARSKVFVDTDLPSDFSDINRLYICCPRIPATKKQLDSYPEKRFEFRASRNGESYLRWMDSNGTTFDIKSPLSEYLKQQRLPEVLPDNWNSRLSRIYCRDYGVIARFTRDEKRSGAPKDYYLAGIRGLGTWGAAWYLDRRFRYLSDVDENEDVQLLIEVIYENGRVADVIDVSSRDQLYFKERNRKSQISKDIKGFIHGG